MYNFFLNNLKYEEQKYIYRLVAVILVFIILVIGYILADLLQPLVLGTFFAYTVNAVVVNFEKKGFKSQYSVPILFFLLVLIFVVLGLYFYLTIYNFLFIENKYDFYAAKIVDYYGIILDQLKQYNLVAANTDAVAGKMAGNQAVIKEYALELVKSAGDWASFFGLIIFYTLLSLVGIKSFKIKAFRAFNKKKAIKVNEINDKIITQVQQYMLTKSYLSLLSGVFVYIVCLAFGLDLALVWGLLAFILNYIPRFGTIIASVFPIFLSVLQFDTIYMVLGFNVSLILAHISIGSYFEPKLFAKRFSLSTLVIFFGLIFWGWYWGVVGVFLAVPLMVILSIIFNNIPALKPVAVYLHSIYPLKEDEERLSLIFHIASSDKVIDEKEKEYITQELSRDVYDKDFIKNYWEITIKNPLSIESIFENKSVEEKIELYRLALQYIIVNDEINDDEIKMIQKIQHIAQLCHKATSKIHKLIALSNDVTIDLDEISDNKVELEKYYFSEQMAFSINELGKKYIELDEFEKAKASFEESLKFFIKIENQDEINESLKHLSALNILLAG